MMHIAKILHPTDLSENSKPAFLVACALARDYQAELIVLHVSKPTPVYAPDGIAMPLPVEEPLELRARLAQVLPSDKKIKVQHRLVDGDPGSEILKAAKGEGADVIVMGTHGATGLMRLLMGSVAEDVLRKAPCPVLTVRPHIKSA
ncbi:MAG TPA: universal stress protein [Gemmata sp.]|nr:universal stress protein [Gemmata sp.]